MRAITFPLTSPDIRRNTETGVQILSAWDEDRRVYKVTEPYWLHTEKRVVHVGISSHATFAAALDQARLTAANMREEIAAARAAADGDAAATLIDQAAALITDATAAAYLESARDAFAVGNYKRAAAWAREALDAQRTSGPQAPAGWRPMFNGAGFYWGAAQDHYNEVYRGVGNASDTLAALHDEARTLGAAREHYVTAGGLPVTAAERSAGCVDWAAMPTWEQESYMRGTHADMTGMTGEVDAVAAIDAVMVKYGLS